MKGSRFFFLLLLSLATFPVLSWSGDIQQQVFGETEEFLPKAYNNPHVSPDVWAKYAPYFLPESHPVRHKLDAIFSKSRATRSRNALKKAGFVNIKVGGWSLLAFAQHKDLKGYAIKAYFDNEERITNCDQLIWRIIGATSVRQTIKRLGFQHLLKVPKKWIYPLPSEPSSSSATRKDFILVVEDMDLVKKKKNVRKWKRSMDKSTLSAAWQVIQEEGLWDTAVPKNLWYSKDGKLAVVDTEYHHRWPIKVRRLNKFLPKSVRLHWKTISGQFPN